MVMWIFPALSAIGGLFSGAAKGQAAERVNQNDAISRNNQANVSRYGVEQGATLGAAQGEEAGKLNRAGIDLDRRRFALAAPDARARQALKGDMMANYQPLTLSGVPPAVAAKMGHFSGGLQVGDTAKQFGALMAKQALLKQMEGDQFEDIPATDFKGALVKPPTLAPYQGPGGLEQGLGWAGLIANIGELLKGGGGFEEDDYPVPGGRYDD